MAVKILLLLKPFSERAALVDGGIASPRKLRHYAALFHRAAALVPLLELDGWDVWVEHLAVAAEHPDATTREAARARLDRLGIERGWVEISGPSRLTVGLPTGPASGAAESDPPGPPAGSQQTTRPAVKPGPAKKPARTTQDRR